MAKTNRSVTTIEDVRIARKAYLKFKGRSERKTDNRQAILNSLRESEVTSL